jgi:hypothetical protein
MTGCLVQAGTLFLCERAYVGVVACRSERFSFDTLVENEVEGLNRPGSLTAFIDVGVDAMEQ